MTGFDHRSSLDQLLAEVERREHLRFRFAELPLSAGGSVYGYRGDGQAALVVDGRLSVSSQRFALQWGLASDDQDHDDIDETKTRYFYLASSIDRFDCVRDARYLDSQDLGTEHHGDHNDVGAA